jgi:hypothetical protein
MLRWLQVVLFEVWVCLQHNKTVVQTLAAPEMVVLSCRTVCSQQHGLSTVVRRSNLYLHYHRVLDSSCSVHRTTEGCFAGARQCAENCPKLCCCKQALPYLQTLQQLLNPRYLVHSERSRRLLRGTPQVACLQLCQSPLMLNMCSTGVAADHADMHAGVHERHLSFA